MKTVLTQQYLNLGKCCDKMRLQERRICELAVNYNSSKLKIGISEAELTFLNSEDNTGFVPLEQRLLRYLDDFESEVWEDPLEIKDQPNYFDKAFNFYGSYTTLSLQEKREHAESQVVNYYKCIIKDLSESNDNLKV
jgi:hypothetical protein